MNNLTIKIDSEFSAANSKSNTEIAILGGQLTALKRKSRDYKSELSVVNINTPGPSAITGADLESFTNFFPDANMKRIEEIQHFHNNIVNILDSELSQEQENLKELIHVTEEQVISIEQRIRALGQPINIPKEFLNQMSDLTSKIYLMEQQNEAYDTLKRLEKEYKEAQKRLKEIQAGQLSDLESIINQRLTILNEDFPGGRMAPSIHFEDEEHYEFSTPKDDGTGTNWKELIFFDLAILG